MNSLKNDILVATPTVNFVIIPSMCLIFCLITLVPPDPPDLVNVPHDLVPRNRCLFADRRHAAPPDLWRLDPVPDGLGLVLAWSLCLSVFCLS